MVVMPCWGLVLIKISRICLDKTVLFFAVKTQTTVLAQQDGFASGYDAMKMARLARKHGAGRFALEDEIDPLVGFLIQAPKGTQIKKNQPLFTFYHTRELSTEDLRELKSTVSISENKPDQVHRLVELIDSGETKAS